MSICSIPNCGRKAPSTDAFCRRHRDAENTYLAIRDRLIAELLVDIPGTSNYGRLVKPIKLNFETQEGNGS